MAESDAKAALFRELIDDASLFPPADFGMARALRAHVRNRESAYAFCQGRFVVPASRLGEWRAARDRTVPMRLSVIADGTIAGDVSAIEALASEPLLAVDAIELRASAPIDLAPFAALDQPIALWLEAPFANGWQHPPHETLARLAALRSTAPANVRVGAKVRCGGLEAQHFPSVDDLAQFVLAAQTHDVPWKATAGLHHPIRHLRAQSTFAMHGFLNLAMAAAAVHAGNSDGDLVRAILAEMDARAFALDPVHFGWRDLRVAASDIAHMRRVAFTSYGSCSFFEPIDDVRQLGMLA